MDESAALAMLAEKLEHAGDDAAVIDNLVITTDMLHAKTDFPDGVSHYTAGWRSVGASLSDVAAMGATGKGAVAVYASPEFDEDDLGAFIDGAVTVCEQAQTEYIGGDLDRHDEFTVVSTAIGETDSPVYRSGAQVGDKVCVTGTLGRTAAAIELFEQGETTTANELFQFQPRIAAGKILRTYATAMIDSSDGLARSVHQLATASDCGISLQSSEIPVASELRRTASADERLHQAITFGEDFELVCTIPEEDADKAIEKTPVPVSIIGEVTETGVTIDDTPLADEGYTH